MPRPCPAHLAIACSSRTRKWRVFALTELREGRGSERAHIRAPLIRGRHAARARAADANMLTVTRSRFLLPPSLPPSLSSLAGSRDGFSTCEHQRLVRGRSSTNPLSPMLRGRVGGWGVCSCSHAPVSWHRSHQSRHPLRWASMPLLPHGTARHQNTVEPSAVGVDVCGRTAPMHLTPDAREPGAGKRV